MKHGANNHAIKSSLFEGRDCIVKTYGNSEQELLKYQREVHFYEFCNKLNCAYVPKLYGVSEFSRIIFIEKIVGSPVLNFSSNFFTSSLEFIKYLNKYKSAYRTSFLAQENLVSPSNLCVYLKSRLEQASSSKLYFPDNFTNIAEIIIKNSSEKFLNFGPIVLNPSDIGTHNAIQVGEFYKFIDFEYAGIDSFAKLAYDYYLHPANFQNEVSLPKFFAKLSDALEIPHQKVDEEIFRLFSLWWVLRLLNHLSPAALKVRLELNLLKKTDIVDYTQQRVELISRYWGNVNA